jgi:galactose oxidase-like protein
MKIEEQLRSAIREYTETIQPDGSAWSRIEEGMVGPSSTQPWRPLILVAAAATALAAIISVRLLIDEPTGKVEILNPGPGLHTPGPTTGSPSTPPPSLPAAPQVAGRWTRMSASPSPQYFSTSVWTGRELILWRGRGPKPGNGFAYNPSTNRWREMPSFVVGGFHNAPAVWTGTEMIVWGGARDESGGDAAAPPPREGGAYNPSSDRWRPIAKAPLYGGADHSAVWTGSEMLMWGSRPDGNGLKNELAAYDPKTDRWRELTPGPLTGRDFASVVWTGSEMLVWGSARADGPVDGAAFDPRNNRWRQIPEAPLSPRRLAAAVWTGEELFVWGGKAPDETNLADGARLDPETNRWTKSAPAPLMPRYFPSIVRVPGGVFVWGGIGEYEEGAQGPPYFKDGAIYEPETDRWRSLPRAPLAGREGAELAVAGKRIIIWGGCCPGSDQVYTDGAVFEPSN